MPHADFRPALARVDRAAEHRQRLWGLAGEHLKAHPIEHWFEPDGDVVRVMVKAPVQFPIEFSIIFGEWLHNLRSALDSLLYELAVEDTRQDPPTRAGNRQFPIMKTPDSDTKEKLAGLSEWTRQGIKNMQPYNHTGGVSGSGIWWLDELARIDRHRRGHVFEWRITDLEIEPDPAVYDTIVRECDQVQAFIRDGENLELGAFRTISGKPPQGDSHICARYRVEFDIPEWFQGVVPTYRWPIDDRMRSIEGAVGQSIEWFERELRQRNEARNQPR